MMPAPLDGAEVVAAAAVLRDDFEFVVEPSCQTPRSMLSY